MPQTFAEIASEGGQALGGFLNPLLGAKTETSVTTKPASSGSMTTILVIVAVVAVLGVVGYFVIKNKR